VYQSFGAAVYGTSDDVRIYNRTSPNAEIRELANATAH
jgi:hypothetical protein